MASRPNVNRMLATGLVTVLVINGVLAWLLSQTFAYSLLTREVAISRDYLQSIVNAENSAAALFAEPAPSPALLHFTAIAENLPGVVRINIYSPDRFIRHSTEANLIGLKFGANHELDESFRGAMTASLEKIEIDPKPEHLGLNKFAGKQFIEAYVPLTGADGNTFAVVEYYSEADALLAELARVRRILVVSELLAGFAMLAALYGLFRKRA
jgi:hypothetical protein